VTWHRGRANGRLFLCSGCGRWGIVRRPGGYEVFDAGTGALYRWFRHLRDAAREAERRAVLPALLGEGRAET
jgi:hypothetical protein